MYGSGVAAGSAAGETSLPSWLGSSLDGTVKRVFPHILGLTHGCGGTLNRKILRKRNRLEERKAGFVGVLAYETTTYTPCESQGKLKGFAVELQSVYIPDPRGDRAIGGGPAAARQP